MGVWNKIGKIALTAAPYVAAPFTGGASLMATGLANKAVQKWSEKDAQKNLAKGLAPSKFDQRLGQVGGYAALGSMFIPGGQLSMLGGAGKAGGLVGTAAKAGNMSKFLSGAAGGGVSGAAGLLGAGANIAGNAAMDRIGSNTSGNTQSSPGQGSSDGSFNVRGLGPSSSMRDAMAQGKSDALKSQPWRADPSAYDWKKRPAIYPN